MKWVLYGDLINVNKGEEIEPAGSITGNIWSDQEKTVVWSKILVKTFQFDEDNWLPGRRPTD